MGVVADFAPAVCDGGIKLLQYVAVLKFKQYSFSYRVLTSNRGGGRDEPLWRIGRGNQEGAKLGEVSW